MFIHWLIDLNTELLTQKREEEIMCNHQDSFPEYQNQQQVMNKVQLD